jgi:hypothetical protein
MNHKSMYERMALISVLLQSTYNFIIYYFIFYMLDAATWLLNHIRWLLDSR